MLLLGIGQGCVPVDLKAKEELIDETRWEITVNARIEMRKNEGREKRQATDGNSVAVEPLGTHEGTGME